MSIDLLKQDIKSRKLKKVYLFFGPEEYLKKYYIETIENMIVNENYKSMNSIKFEGRIELEKLMEAAETLPFFSEKKLVLVKNSGFFKAKSSDAAEKKESTQKAELPYILANLPEYTCVIFYEDDIDRRTKAVDAVKKNGLVVEFPYQKPADLVKWVINIIRSFGKDIDTMTASKLVDNCDQGMNQILNEVNKLMLYTGPKKNISVDDVDRVCVKSIKSRIFDLIDAIAEKKPDKAIKVLDDLVAVKEPIPKILFMIGKHFRQLLEIKHLRDQGLNSDQIASRMGISSYAASKIMRQTGMFTEDKLKRAIEESLRYDIAIKSGNISDRIAVELLITTYSSGV